MDDQNYLDKPVAEPAPLSQLEINTLLDYMSKQRPRTAKAVPIPSPEQDAKTQSERIPTTPNEIQDAKFKSEHGGFKRVSNEEENPFLAPKPDFTNMRTIKATMNNDGLLEEDNSPNPFLVGEEVTTNPFVTDEPKNDWWAHGKDARDFGKTNSAMGAPKRSGTALERMQLAAEEAFATNPILGRDDGRTQMKLAKNLTTKMEMNPWLTTEENIKKVEELQKDGINRLAKYITLRQGIAADIAGANPSFLESLVGGFGPGLADPMNLIPVGKASTIFGTAIKAGAIGLPIGISSAMMQGDADMLIGLRKDNPTIKELLSSGVESSAIMAAIAVLFHGASKSGVLNPKISKETAAAAAKIKDGSFEAGKDNPYPAIDKEFKDNGYSDLDASQTQFADALAPQETGANSAPKKPYSDLEAPLREGTDNLPYPEIEGEIPNQGAKVESASYIPRPKEERIPYQEPQGAVPYEPFKDVSEPTEPTGYPRLPNALPEIASVEKEPSTHGMDFYDFNNDVDVADLKNPFVPQESVDAANAQGLQGTSKMGFRKVVERTKSMATDALKAVGIDLSGDFTSSAKLVNELYTITDAKGLSDFIVRNSKNPQYVELAKRIDNYLEGVPFQLRDRDSSIISKLMNKDLLGTSLAVVNRTADLETSIAAQTVGMRGLGDVAKGAVSPFQHETIIHELVHVATEAAIALGSDKTLNSNSKYNPHRVYVKELTALYERAKKAWDESDFERTSDKIPQLQDIREFNAYGWTDPQFRTFLESVPYHGTTLWGKIKEFTAKLFGKDVPKNILDGLDKLQDDLANVQGTPVELGQSAIREWLASGRSSKNSAMKEYKPDVVLDLHGIKNGQELLNYIKEDTIGDLGYAVIKNTPILKEALDFINRNLTTPPRQAGIFKHPVLLWVAQHIPSINRKAEIRIQQYKTQLEGFDKVSRDDQLKIFKTLTDINHPQLLGERQNAVDTNTIPQYLESRGLNPEQVKWARTVLDVMADLYKNDQMSAGRMGRGLPEIPMYFPRSHGGTFKFKVVDDKGNLRYLRGFESAIEAQKAQTEMAALFKDNADGLQVFPVERVDIPGMLDNLGDMLVESSLPEYLKKQVQDLEERMETSKRRFEIERAKMNVGGFIGELLHDETMDAGRKENNRLLDLMQNRIDDSYRFETQSRIVDEIVKPLMWDAGFTSNKPRLSAAMNTIVLRELGFDVSKMRWLDDGLQKTADSIGKWVNQQAAKLLDYEASNVSILRPNEIKHWAQNATWLTSAWTLGWNIPVWTINTLQIPMVAADGVRTAFREGKNPLLANLAYMKLPLSIWDEGAMNFMEQARLEGVTQARAADLFTITESHGAQGVQKKIDSGVNFVRNKIEEATNYFTVLYYYHYYNLTNPALNPTSEAFKSKVYQATRSWTGDYSSLATAPLISKAGIPGTLSGNFAKWSMNQSGRFLEDLSTIRDDPVKLQAYMPLLANAAAIVLLGGIQGLPVISDYEYWRKLGQQTGLWDWKPFAGFYKEVQDFSKKHNLPQGAEWLKRGAMTEANDLFVQKLTGGKESGPDFSGSLRHAPVVQANTVAVSTFMDIFMGSTKALKYAWNAAGMGEGWKEQDTKDFVKMWPAGFQNLLEDKLLLGIKQQRGDKYITQGMKKEEGTYAQSEFERRMELGGFRSKKQNEHNDIRQYQLWLERSNKEKVSSLLDATLNNTHNKELVQKNLKQIYQIGGDTAVQNFYNQLVQRPIDKSTTYDERKALEFINTKDVTAKRDLANQIKEFQKLRSKYTSSNRSTD